MNAPANIDTTRAIPSPDHTAIRSHIEMQHALAKNAGVEGVLTLTRIDGKDKIFTERFAIGDVDSHANAVIGWSSNTGVNLYSPWAIFRNDLPRGSKGAEEHVVAALLLLAILTQTTARLALVWWGFRWRRRTLWKRRKETFNRCSH
jgi:hypothetical protein